MSRFWAFPIYEWSDGTTAEVLFHEDLETTRWIRLEADDGETQLDLHIVPVEKVKGAPILAKISPGWLVLAPNRPSEIPSHAWERKLRGLMLDLGGWVSRHPPPEASFLRALAVSKDGSFLLRIPWFVDDAVFEETLGRIDQSNRTEGPWQRMFGVHVKVVWENGEIYVSDPLLVGSAPELSQWQGLTPLASMVEETLASLDLARPASAEDSWMRENVEFGEFLTLDRGEVELFATLGERCPVWWEDVDRAIEFFRERVDGAG